jgi:hypothetical protein
LDFDLNFRPDELAGHLHFFAFFAFFAFLRETRGGKSLPHRSEQSKQLFYQWVGGVNGTDGPGSGFMGPHPCFILLQQLRSPDGDDKIG